MRINTILTLAVVLSAAVCSNLQAQTEGKKREVGIQFTNLNFDGFTTFSVLYRKQKSENVYRRIRATFGSIYLQSANDNNTLGFNAGMSIGREKRRALDGKLEFYRGPEFSVGLGLTTGDVQDSRAGISLGFGYVLGLQHSFNERWAVNVETIPAIGVNLNVGENSVNDRLGAGVNANSTVSLGVIRKF